MRIAIDIRSLQNGTISGVESYTRNLVHNLLSIDRDNEYIFFYNSLNTINFPEFHYINARVVNFGLPNKFLNLSLVTLKKPQFEKWLGKIDILFLPNFNYFGVSDDTKVVLTVHDLSAVINPAYFSWKMRLWHKSVGMKKSIERANKILAVSEHTKYDINRMYSVGPGGIEVLYPAPSLSAYPPLDPVKIRKVRNNYSLPFKFYVTLSTLEPRKNLVSVVEAFDLIKDDTELLIVGRPGWKYKELYKKAKESRKRKLIRFLGAIPEHDKPYILSQATALIYPSFYEGFGIVPVEAFALSVPVVSASVTSLPEILGDASLMVNPYNTSDLAYAMQVIAQDTKLRQKLITKGLARVPDFSWQKSAQKLLNIFNSL